MSSTARPALYDALDTVENFRYGFGDDWLTESLLSALDVLMDEVKAKLRAEEGTDEW